MINILERRFDLSACLPACIAQAGDARADRLANGLDRLTVKKITERVSSLLEKSRIGLS